MWLWILLGLASSALMYLAGRWDGFRSGREATWAAADAHFRRETQALHEQLANDERELSARQEADHALIRDGSPMPTNRAGYRPDPNLNDSPTRSTGAGPSAPSQRKARV
jgi:hypothetical protein